MQLVRATRITTRNENNKALEAVVAEEAGTVVDLDAEPIRDVAGEIFIRAVGVCFADYFHGINAAHPYS